MIKERPFLQINETLNCDQESSTIGDVINALKISNPHKNENLRIFSDEDV